MTLTLATPFMGTGSRQESSAPSLGRATPLRGGKLGNHDVSSLKRSLTALSSSTAPKTAHSRKLRFGDSSPSLVRGGTARTSINLATPPQTFR